MMLTATYITLPARDLTIPVVRSKPMETLLQTLTRRRTDQGIRLRFCDAYEALSAYFTEEGIEEEVYDYDAFMGGSVSTATLPAICAMTAFSKCDPQQCEEYITLWLNTFSATVRETCYEGRSHLSYLDSFLRMFSTAPTKEQIVEKCPYRVPPLIQQLIEHTSSYYVLQDQLSRFYDDLGFQFHEDYVNCLTLGISCFLRTTYGHPQQKEMLSEYIIQQIKMNLSDRTYYDTPEAIQEEYLFTI